MSDETAIENATDTDTPAPASTPEGAAPAAAPAEEASTSPASANAAPETSSDDAASGGAVDTGRRIDPSRLSLRDPKRDRDQKTRLRKKEGAAEGPAPAEGAAGASAPGDRPAGEGANKKRRRRPKKRVVEKDELYAKKERTDADRGPQVPKGMPPRRPEPPPVDDGTAGKSFAELLDEVGSGERIELEVGDRVEGKIIHIGSDSVFVQLGSNVEATLPLAEVLDEDGAPTVQSGQRIEAYVVSLRGGVELSKKLGRHGFDPALLEQAAATGMPVDGLVTGVNKGGLEVQVLGTRGFCPIGQVALGFIEDPAKLVGQTMAFLVREVKSGGREVLLSRKALLERERKEKAAATLAGLAVGQSRQGVVTRIADFGAFVDLGGIDGLVPISELSHSRVDDVASVVSVGDQVTVEVLRIEDDPKRQGEKRIGLSLKQALPDPFVAMAAEIQPGSNVWGRVVRIKPFGAFVELVQPGSGVEGLIHVSEVSDRRLRSPADVLEEGQEVTVRVLDVRPEERRISLSLKDADLPERAAGETAQQAAARGGLSRGARVKGVVDRIERYGVFVQIEGMGSALLPASETGTPRGTDLGKVFPLGTELDLLVIDIDERGRAKVSKVAREKEEERSVMQAYTQKQQGTSGGGGFGTLGDLLKKRLGG